MLVRWQRLTALALAGAAFAGTTMGASSCSESAAELEKSADDLDDLSGGNDAQYRKKIRRVSLGMSKSEVRSIMGEAPRDKQKMESEYGTSEMWYYGSWQLAFDDGRLTGKNRY